MFLGDGNVSLVEFVKIVSNIGNASAAQQTDLTQEQQEEQELRDAFRVCFFFFFVIQKFMATNLVKIYRNKFYKIVRFENMNFKIYMNKKL